MLPGSEPFLAAIAARPDDDTPRLVFADWLDENGDPDRAAFIRGQIELARQAAAGETDPDLLARTEGLLAARGDAWLADLPVLKGGRWDGFRRGFVAGAVVENGWLAATQRNQLFRATPLESLVVESAEYDYLRRVTELVELDRLRELSLLNCRIGDDGWGLVTLCPNLRSLRRLTLGKASDSRQGLRGGPILTDTDARSFFQSSYFPHLTDLHLIGWVSAAATTLLRQRFATVRVDAWLRK